MNDLVLTLQMSGDYNATFVASFVNLEVRCISIGQQSIEMQLELIRKVITDVKFLSVNKIKNWIIMISFSG